MALIAAGLLTLFFSVPAAGSDDLVTPLAPVPNSGPWTGQYQARQFRMMEAQTKSRLTGQRMVADRTGQDKATANMDFYDVHFYGLDLELNPSTQILQGTVLVGAAVVGSPIASLDLNLQDNMAVLEVRAGGLATGFSRSAHILTINLDRQYLPGEQVSVEIDYAGNPESADFGWDTYGGEPLIWTLSEPYGARKWWPCKDLNTDKADSVDINVTVPDNLIPVSNGLLDEVTVPAPGQHTYHWRERYPIVPYLVAVTAHPFMVLHDQYQSLLGGPMPLDYYIIPEWVDEATAFDIVPNMMVAFAAAFSEYPFVNEKYGHVHFPWGGGMEHQTMTSLGYWIYNHGIIAHELGHQWFGDLVTCADFRHIWLNEGFATWTEAYWREVSEGESAYHDEMALARYLGPGSIFVENPTNSSVIFDYDLTYRKASWVPHMLRHILGDTDFFFAVRQYLDLYGHDSATTEQLQAVMEDVSGRDLTAFFQQWIYGEFYPIYDYSWDWWANGDGYRVSLRVEQSQTLTGLFTMPLDVVIQTAGGPVDFVIENSEQIQYYHFQVDDPVTAILLDPDHWVLREAWDRRPSGAEGGLPGAARLVGNVPNPFNPTTEIRFVLPDDQAVQLAVYDVSGRMVKTLVDEMRPAGDNSVRWNGTDRAGRSVAAGTYFARLTGAGLSEVRPMSLVR